MPTLLINAGGTSRRMGRSKALLPTPPDGKPLILRVAERLRPLVDGCVVVANDALVCAAVAPQAAPCLPDAYPDAGPLGGMATGLAHVDGWAICVACDMPFVQPTLFRFLLDLTVEYDAGGPDRWDAIVPHVADRPQPLHALYHSRCLPSMTARLEAGQHRAGGFLVDVHVRWVTEEEVRTVDPTLSSFFNANTAADWQQALQQMETE